MHNVVSPMSMTVALDVPVIVLQTNSHALLLRLRMFVTTVHHNPRAPGPPNDDRQAWLARKNQARLIAWLAYIARPHCVATGALKPSVPLQGGTCAAACVAHANTRRPESTYAEERVRVSRSLMHSSHRPSQVSSKPKGVPECHCVLVRRRSEHRRYLAISKGLRHSMMSVSLFGSLLDCIATLHLVRNVDKGRSSHTPSCASGAV
jgi:hypothetical protein